MFLKTSQLSALFFFTLALSVQPVFAINWNDLEWSGRGCPVSLEGVWKAETMSSLAGQEIEFHKDGTLLVIQSGRDLKLKFKGDLKAGNQRFINLEIMSDIKNSYPTLIKIRPHLGPDKGASNSSPEGRCRIKLFRYENQKRAKQNREHSWDIYYAAQ